MKRLALIFSLASVLATSLPAGFGQAPAAAEQPQPAPATPAPNKAEEDLRKALREAIATNQPASTVSNVQRPLRSSTPPRPANQPATTPAQNAQPALTPATTATPPLPTTAQPSAPRTSPSVSGQPRPVPPRPGVTTLPGTPAPAATNIPSNTALPGPTDAVGASAADLLPGNEDEIAALISFENSPLDAVLDYYMQLSGRTVLKSQALTGAITLKSRGDLTRKEALQALDTVLALNGITMIPTGTKFVKAVTAQQAILEGAAFTTTKLEDLPEADQYVTHIVQLKHANPVEIVPALQPLSKTPTGIIVLEATRMIVLRDYAANVKRMLEVIERVDIVPEMDYKLVVLPIKFGRVEEIYDTMSSLIGGGGGGGVAGGVAGAGGVRSGRAASGARTNSRLAGQNQQGRQGQLGQTGAGATPAPSQNSFQNRLQQIVNRAATGGEVQLLGDAKIVPDTRSNALIVFANKQDMEMITNIIAKVDVLLAQVLIEAIIVDVGIGSQWQLGVSAVQQPAQNGDWAGAGAMHNGGGLFNSLTNFGAGLPGGFTYLAKYKDDFNIAVQAISSDNNAQIIQTPRIQTSHAVPASFFSGETRPYPMGTSGYGGVSSGIGGSYYPSVNYQQLEIGVGIDVTPYITPDGLVVMEVNQTVDGIIGTEELPTIGKVPITSRRTATATVSVRDRDTILLGGFINSQKSKTKSGVPLMKDIPGIGWMFRSSSSDKKRSELIILMRPTILSTPQDAALAAQRERERLPGVAEAERKFMEDFEKHFKAEQEKEKSKKRNKKSQAPASAPSAPEPAVSEPVAPETSATLPPSSN